MSLVAGTRLGSYELLAPLGAGGMGEVYRARDGKLKREVAIKVLPESLAKDVSAMARFEREALAVAALSHPNILSIHDFGTHQGTAYAVTELLEGVTLREMLKAGPMPVPRAVAFALQIAKGLSAAHEKGIVHRDLKPENLFVGREGHVKILDFGLAKRMDPARSEDEPSVPTLSKQTEPGTFLGTVGYVSPEQVKGLAVDHRSDIFAFGTVLYEMLSGTRAFKRNTSAETLAAILTEEPAQLADAGGNVPVTLDRLVRHCLEKNPEDRFQSAKDIAFALSENSSGSTHVARSTSATTSGKRFAAALTGAAALVAVAGIMLLRNPQQRSRVTGGPRRVAVLPFENLGSPENDYFVEGIGDEVRGKLTFLPGLEVIARGSSTPYKKTTKTPLQIAQELDARYLLTATVRWEKQAGVSRVQVIPELVEVSSSRAPISKWQQPFDAALTDVFEVQSDIATRVAQALGLALGTGEQKQLGEKPTQNLAAYEAFLKGEEASTSIGTVDPLKLRSALGSYEQAVALDPYFATAWAQLARANANLYLVGTPTPALAERAREAAERAVTLAPSRPEGYLARGDYEYLVVADFKRALGQYEEGQRHAAGSADLLTALVQANEAIGRWEGVIDDLKQAERLDPRSVSTKLRLGTALVYLRRYPEARDVASRGLALAPANLTLIQQKVLTFLAQGDLAEAREVIRATPEGVEPTALVAYMATYTDLVWLLDVEQRALLLRLTPSAFDDDKGVWGLCLAQAYALKGDVARVRALADEARQAYEAQLRASPQDARRHVLLGLALAYLGRNAEAMREGERAVALRPITKDAYLGPQIQRQLVRIYVLVGEPEKAIDRLEPLLKIPGLLSPGWLKIDPNFDPLRRHPRFQKLISGGNQAPA